jgi:hypothetical protein
LQEAKDLKLQSDQITKLSQKIQEIDKWKQEVLNLDEEEEKSNYKRFKDHYRMLLAKSSVF